MRRTSLAGLLAVLAGTAMSAAQPVVDGRLTGDEARYGAAKWTQDTPTGFGDNRPDLDAPCNPVGGGIIVAYNNTNVGGVGGSQGTAAAPGEGSSVTTGFEIRIPLSELGNPVGTIKLTGWINGGNNYLSNQVIGGFNPAVTNLGGNGSGGYVSSPSPDIGSVAGINFNNFAPATQWANITIPGSPASSAGPAVDGVRESFYDGGLVFEQDNQTGFGDNSSELDAVWARVEVVGGVPYLFLFIGGNLEANGNRIDLFFDTGAAGGQNVLDAGNPTAGLLNGRQGLTFDTGFNANYFLTIRNNSGNNFPVDFAEVKTVANGGRGSSLGTGTLTTPIVASPCPPTLPSDFRSLGSEIDVVYSYVDRSARKLYLLITGNVQEGNALALFLDTNGNPSGDEGQNQLQGNGSPLNSLGRKNVVLGLDNNLNRLGYNAPGNEGLKFDTGFAADYFTFSKFENSTRTTLDAAVLRTGGRLETLGGQQLDYNYFAGKPVNSIITSDGTSATDYVIASPGLQTQFEPATLDNIGTHFAPRESARVLQRYRDAHPDVNFPMDPNEADFPPDQAAWNDWLTGPLGPTTAPAADRPKPNLIVAALRNNNIAGVTDTAASSALALTATTGLELALSFDEIGFTNPRARVKLAGFIINGNFSTVSNQVIGGLGPAGTNLNEPRTIDFSGIPGDQFVVVASCAADFNGVGGVSVQDIFDFLAAWFASNLAADINSSGTVTVQDIFDFLALWFQGPCL